MDTVQVVALVIFCLLHLTLAVMLLHDLAEREKVFGGRKAPWAVAIIFLTFIGPLLYLLFHPIIFIDRDGKGDS
jgi:hypothetical protein